MPYNVLSDTALSADVTSHYVNMLLLEGGNVLDIKCVKCFTHCTN